jgi:alkylation response protein AidB-like acyl-CoA dehydrogenase
LEKAVAAGAVHVIVTGRSVQTAGPVFDDLRYDGLAVCGQGAQLYDAGYVGVTWPKEFGGQGRGHVENALLQEELVRSGAPPSVNGLGIGLCGSRSSTTGARRRRSVSCARCCARGDVVPGLLGAGAGSTSRTCAPPPSCARSLRRTARRSGPRWHTARTGSFCLVRTDLEGRQARGIGFLDRHEDAGIEVARWCR